MSENSNYFIFQILLFGMLYAIILSMKKDGLDKQDELSVTLLKAFSLFCGAVGILGGTTLSNLVKQLLAKFRPYIFVVPALYLITFLTLVFSLTFNEKKTIEKDWIPNPSYVENKKNLFNRVAVVLFSVSTVILFGMVLYLLA